MTTRLDPRSAAARMIRVDQAGEFGATRIYEGQLAVMGDRGPDSAEIVEMARQEGDHRARFDALMARRGVRGSPAAAASKGASGAMAAAPRPPPPRHAEWRRRRWRRTC